MEYLKKLYQFKLHSVVLSSSATVYYDQFDNPESLGRYIIRSGNWEVRNGYLSNNNSKTCQSIVYLGDFPSKASLTFLFKTTDECKLMFQLFEDINLNLLVMTEVEISQQSVKFMVEKDRDRATIDIIHSNIEIDWLKTELNALRISWVEDKLGVYLNGKLLKSINAPKPSPKGFGLTVFSGTVDLKSISISTSESESVKLTGLPDGFGVVIQDDKGNMLHPEKSLSAGEVHFRIAHPILGRFVIENEGNKIQTPEDVIIGGDVFAFKAIDALRFMTECTEKLFDTFWLEENEKAGVIARIGDHSAFIEATEFAYFYKLLPEFLLTGDTEILRKISKIRNFNLSLREDRKNSTSYGLFYERTILEKGERNEQIVRGINEGVAGRFLAFDYVLTGNKKNIDYLVDLLDGLIRVGMVDVNSGELHLYSPANGKLGIDTDVKNSYLLDAFTMGYCLTGKQLYLDVATKTADWLIEKNLDPQSGTFPRTSTHDTMEFLEAVWNVYLVTQNEKYLRVVDNCISAYLKMRYRWGGVPFRHFGKDATYSVDVLAISQMFLGIKLDIWTNTQWRQEQIEQLVAYLHSVRINEQATSLELRTSKSLMTRMLYKKRGWKWNEKFWQKYNLWNFRHSSITKEDVYENWASQGNINSFILSYINLTILSFLHGSFIGFQGRYYPHQPLLLFSSARLFNFRSKENMITFDIAEKGHCKIIMFVPAHSIHNLIIRPINEIECKKLSSSDYGQTFEVHW